MGQLSDGMAALIRYANETTGESDTTLSDAVDSLVAGYGGGGDLSDFSVLYADGTREQMAPSTSLFLAASMAVLGKPVHSIIANGAVLWPKIALPGEYQAVSFVENTGGQYLELPFGFAPTDKIMLIAEFVEMRDDKFLVAPKIWNDTGANRFAIGGSGGGVAQYGYGASGTNVTYFTLRATQGIHTFCYDNYKFSYDNYNNGGDVSSIAFVGTTANLRLFFGYDWPTTGRIYRYIHRKGGTTYCLVPCYRKSDGVIGMYDITTQSFYTNQGSGTFAKGQDINLRRLPDAYTEVEYIKSTGGQAIDTGVQIDTSLIVRSTVSFDALPTSRTCLFGFDTWFYGLSLLYDGVWKMLYHDRYTNLTGTPITTGSWYAMEMDTKQGAQSAILGDMTASDNYDVQMLPYSNSIFLFATSVNGSVSTPASVAMKETSIYNNGALVRNLIPCVRNADEVVGMYDLVYNIFYTNIGTGTFIAGPAI